MKIVLDSNEYILYFQDKAPTLMSLLDSPHEIHMHVFILEEIRRNMLKDQVQDLKEIIKKRNIKLHNFMLPGSLIEKYKNLGLKKGDIFIAAFCDHIQADFLITENRHFLRELKEATFKTLSAAKFLEQNK